MLTPVYQGVGSKRCTSADPGGGVSRGSGPPPFVPRCRSCGKNCNIHEIMSILLAVLDIIVIN